jgi:hypothetical protein
MLFLLGLLLGGAGLAIIVTGRIRLFGNRAIEGKPCRRAGAVWLGFFPIILLTSFVLNLVGLETSVDPRLVFWIIGALCFLVGLWFLLPGFSKRRAGPRAGQLLSVTKTKLDSKPATSAPRTLRGLPFAPPPDKKETPPPAVEKNPFDFS